MKIMLSLVAVFFALAPALTSQQPAEQATPQPVQEGTPPPAASPISDESLKAQVELPFQKEVFQYNKIGRRDPFQPLLSIEEGSAPNVNNLALVGIMWGSARIIAVVKELGGMGFVLEEGDKVAGGIVERITNDSVTFKLNEFGVITRFTLTLKGQGRM